jgi:hypothetical protein
MEETYKSLQPYKEAFDATRDMLSWVDMVQPSASHPSFFPAWQASAEDLMKEAFISSELGMNTKEERRFEEAKQIGFSLLEKFMTKARAVGWSSQTPEERRAHVEHLLALPQIPQRTPEWYAQGKEVLTASEFSTLFGTPRAFSQMVLSKVPPSPAAVGAAAAAAPTRSTNRLACMTCEMGPFDWGIRFEPVVKQHLERLWGARIAESGRLTHPTDPHLAASPDGLILSAADPARVGRLVEIKCPITREVGDGIPFEYWCQMQVQMEVTGIEECEYVEVKIESLQKMNTALLSGKAADGYVWLLQDPSTTCMAYAYTEAEKEAREAAGWDLIEEIPWRIADSWMKTVVRDRAWYRGTEAVRRRFWTDVTAARAGAYEAVASSRSCAVGPRQVIVHKEGATSSACMFLDEDDSV